MIFDSQNVFDNDVALTVTRNSSNVIDLIKAGQDIGVGENLWLYFTVTTVLDSAGEAATLQIALVTDDNAALSSATVIQDMPALITEATLVAGYEILWRVRPVRGLEQYLGVIYTVGTENFTSGKIFCALVKDVQWSKAFPDNIVTA